MDNFPYYRGDGAAREEKEPVDLPISPLASLQSEQQYLADSGLRHAANVALLLGQPLLLTGEAGTGKTRFAYSLAWELGYGAPLKFETKSTTVASDLFYTYDALRRFQDVQVGEKPKSALPYLVYQALGVAILRSHPEEKVAEFLPPTFEHGGQSRSVVLVDEVDKAPRDFPNDILNEVENMYFRIPELGNIRIDTNPALRPVVIFTSNSEKDLPDAFLRRCIYYHIPFPPPERMEEIVANRLGAVSAANSELVRQALSLFYFLRQPGRLRKKPATAELLGWLLAIKEIGGDPPNLVEAPDLILQTLSVLVKTEDQQTATQYVTQWLEQQSR